MFISKGAVLVPQSIVTNVKYSVLLLDGKILSFRCLF